MEDKNINKDKFHLEDLISLREAADYSGLSSSHLRLLVRRGDVEGKKIGRNWVTTRQAVDQYLASAPQRGPKPE